LSTISIESQADSGSLARLVIVTATIVTRSGLLGGIAAAADRTQIGPDASQVRMIVSQALYVYKISQPN
jgi:hypothetical protein